MDGRNNTPFTHPGTKMVSDPTHTTLEGDSPVPVQCPQSGSNVKDISETNTEATLGSRSGSNEDEQMSIVEDTAEGSKQMAYPPAAGESQDSQSQKITNTDDIVENYRLGSEVCKEHDSEEEVTKSLVRMEETSNEIPTSDQREAIPGTTGELGNPPSMAASGSLDSRGRKHNDRDSVVEVPSGTKHGDAPTASNDSYDGPQSVDSGTEAVLPKIPLAVTRQVIRAVGNESLVESAQDPSKIPRSKSHSHPIPARSDGDVPMEGAVATTGLDTQPTAQVIAVVEGSSGSTHAPDRVQLTEEAVEISSDDSEDEDEEDSEEESDYERLEECIKDELCAVLDSSFSASPGTFASMTSYTTPPNPAISITGFGMLGLPLSATEASRLRTVCNRAPFGKGERTVVDTEVRDTWELEPDKVKFGNPDWNGWLNETVVRKVCADLGVPADAVPRMELYKMLLYETGSHFHAHQDTEKSNGMFATIVIVLPSQFQGGEVHVSHGKKSKVFDPAQGSLFTTTALSWYTDVVHEVKPVTSGFRLALSFNLIRNPSAPYVPKPPSLDGPVEDLERVLKAWRHAEIDGEDPVTGQELPQKLAYILDHQYSHANLSFDKLKGRDRSMVLNLREVCEQEGFQLGLGSLKFTQSGEAEEDYGGYRGYGRYGRGRQYGYQGDEGVTMGEIESTSCTVQLISGPNGECLGREVALEMDELMVDENYFDDETPDDQEYEGYQGNWAGSLEYFYRRTVLLIWPDSENVSVVTSMGGTAAAIASLRANKSTTPSKHDLDLVDIALSSAAISTETGRFVADLAVRWQDPALWLRAVNSSRAGSNVSVFGATRLVAAYDKFAFPSVGPVLDNVISNTTSTTARLDFISILQSHPKVSIQPFWNAPDGWFDAKRVQVLRSLRQVGINDISPIVSAASTQGGWAILRDTIIPQLVAFNLPLDWWKTFIQHMRQWTQDPSHSNFQGWVEPVIAAAGPVFEKALLTTESNAHRFQIIDQLQQAIPDGFAPPFSTWFDSKRDQALTNLKAVNSNDIPYIVSAASALGALPKLRDIVLPQLVSSNLSAMLWTDFIEHLHLRSQGQGGERFDGWFDPVFAVARPVFENALLGMTSNVGRFTLIEQVERLVPGSDALKIWGSERRSWAIRSLVAPSENDIPLFIKLVKEDKDFMTRDLIPKLSQETVEIGFWNEFIAQLIAEEKNDCVGLPANWREMIVPLLAQPIARLLAPCTSNQQLFAVFEGVATLMRGQPVFGDFIESQRRTAFDRIQRPTNNDVPCFMREMQRDPTFGPTVLYPKLRKFACGVDFWKHFIRTIQSQRASLMQHGWTHDSFKTFITNLVDTAIIQTPIQAAAPPPPPPPTYGYGGRYGFNVPPATPAVVTTMSDLLTLCIETSNFLSSSHLFHKLFTICVNQDAIQHTLLPLFPIVVKLLQKHQLAIDTPPFDIFFREAIKTYATGLLGPKPSPTSRVWKGAKSTCTCTDCQEVNRLIAKPDAKVVWRAAQNRRQHVELKLRGLPGLTLNTIRYGSPHGLEITKSDAFLEAEIWKKRSEEGIKLLTSIGNQAFLSNLWTHHPGGLGAVVLALKGLSNALTLPTPEAPPVPHPQPAVATRPAQPPANTAPTPAPSSSTVTPTAAPSQALPAKNSVAGMASSHPTPGSSNTRPPTAAAASNTQRQPSASNQSASKTVPTKRKANIQNVDIDLTLDSD